MLKDRRVGVRKLLFEDFFNGKGYQAVLMLRVRICARLKVVNPSSHAIFQI
jgi:hypothetical protein